MYRPAFTILLLALFLLTACGKKEEAAAPAPEPVAARAPAATPATEPAAALPPPAATVPERGKIERRPETERGQLECVENERGQRVCRYTGRVEEPRRAAMANGDGSAALSADQERMRQRDAYLASLQQGSYTFNPPSPIKVAQPVNVALWVDPVKSTAELADEMRRSLPATARVEAGRTAWSPRMKATLTGVDFEITPVDGKDFDGVRDLSATARTEWGWTLVPTSPGKKQLNLVLSVIMPPELGLPRELPQLVREVQVEVTLWWLIDHYWERYWQWMLGGLASAAAASIAWWWQHRRGDSKQG